MQRHMSVIRHIASSSNTRHLGVHFSSMKMGRLPKRGFAGLKERVAALKGVLEEKRMAVVNQQVASASGTTDPTAQNPAQVHSHSAAPSLPSQPPSQELEEEEYEYDEDDVPSVPCLPTNFMGNGGDQTISYIMELFKRQGLSEKRGKGKAPSSQHPSNGGPPPHYEDRDPNLSFVKDPNYFPPPPVKKGRGTKGRGRGRASDIPQAGRGRSRGAANSTIRNGTFSDSCQGPSSSRGPYTSYSSTSPKKGEHWRPNELSALVKGANHLKPVMKGRFKHSSDGTMLKKLAWEELRDYVNSNGGRNRTKEQCQDKLGYFVQKAKKKRQNIDAKYSTGSGARHDGDFLTELEQAGCDYAGEEVTLGIAGLQPPDLKTGRRPNPVSCYHPERPEREDYVTLALPSSALTAAIEGELLEEESVTAVTSGPARASRETSFDRQTAYDYENMDLAGQYDEADEEAEYVKEEPEVTIIEPPLQDLPERVSRQDMLRICTGSNKMLHKAGQKKSSASNILLSTSKESKTSESQIQKALKAVAREGSQSNRKRKTSDNPEAGPSTSTVQNPKRVRKSPSFSTIINETIEQLSTPPPSPDPPAMLGVKHSTPSPVTNQKEKVAPKTYTQSEVTQLLLAARGKKKPDSFTASTPVHDKPPTPNSTSGFVTPSPILRTKKTTRTPEIPSRVSPRKKQTDANNSTKKCLFSIPHNNSGNMAVADNSVLLTPPPAAPVTTLRIDEERFKALHIKFLEDTAMAISDGHARMNAAIMHTQQQMADSTGAMAESTAAMSDSTKAVTQSLTSAMRLHSERMMVGEDACIQKFEESNAALADSTKALTLSLTAAMKDHSERFIQCTDACIDKFEEANQAINEVDEKLVERLLKKQVKMVQGLEKIDAAVTSCTHRMARSQDLMVTALVNMAETVTKMSSSMSSLAQTTEALNRAQEHSRMVQDNSNRATEAIVANWELLAKAQRDLNEATVHKREAEGNSTLKPSADMSNPDMSAYLTHPDPPTSGTDPLYDVQTTLPDLQVNDIKMIVPASAVQREMPTIGLPEYTVLDHQHFVLLQDNTEDIDVGTKEERLEKVPGVKNGQPIEGPSESDSVGSLSDNEVVSKRSVRVKKPKIPFEEQ